MATCGIGGALWRVQHKGIELHGLLVSSLDRDAVPAIARRFGLLQGRTIMLDNEGQSAVLMDSVDAAYPR